MGDSSEPTAINEEPAVDGNFKCDSRRQIQSLPRDFREYDELTNDLRISAKFYSVPRRLATDVELEVPKRKGGLPRFLDFLTRRRTSKELRYHKQENDSTEGSIERGGSCHEREAPVTSSATTSRPTSILLRPWLATEEEAASLTGLSKSPLLNSPEAVTESVSLSPSLQNILQIIQKSSVFMSNTKPMWINEENIMVIAHIDYRGTAEEHLSFKVGQRIFQTKGADDNGLAFGTMKKHRFAHHQEGYYPANYVIPKPVKPQFQLFRICRRRVSRLFSRAEETKDPAEAELEEERRACLPAMRKGSKSCMYSVYPVIDDLGPISSLKL